IRGSPPTASESSGGPPTVRVRGDCPAAPRNGASAEPSTRAPAPALPPPVVDPASRLGRDAGPGPPKLRVISGTRVTKRTQGGGYWPGTTRRGVSLRDGVVSTAYARLRRPGEPGGRDLRCLDAAVRTGGGP